MKLEGHVECPPSGESQALWAPGTTWSVDHPTRTTAADKAVVCLPGIHERGKRWIKCTLEVPPKNVVPKYLPWTLPPSVSSYPTYNTSIFNQCACLYCAPKCLWCPELWSYMLGRSQNAIRHLQSSSLDFKGKCSEQSIENRRETSS